MRVEVPQVAEMRARADEDLAGAGVQRVIAETELRSSPGPTMLADGGSEAG